MELERENDIDYQFEGNEISRVDSQIMHSTVVRPVIRLLYSSNYYKVANKEFLSTHDYYRHKRYKEYLTDCCK